MSTKDGMGPEEIAQAEAEQAEAEAPVADDPCTAQLKREWREAHPNAKPLEREAHEAKQLEIKICGFDDLPPEIDRDDLSNNGSGKEYASYLLIYVAGKLLRCESSAMEPEDVSFWRDLKWVKSAIEETVTAVTGVKR